MSAPTRSVPPLAGGASLRVPTSPAEYRALGERRHTEYADGLLIVNPPTRQHERVVRRLVALLDPAVPSTHELFTGWGWRLEDERERQPDLMVTDRSAVDDTILVSPPPLLVVEVTSPSTVDIDRGSKLADYSRGAAGWYWIVDPGQVTIFELNDGLLVEVQCLLTPAVAAGPFPVLVDPATLTG